MRRLVVFDPVIVRNGHAHIKKGGIASWRGWQDRWLVLTITTLVIYKNIEKQEICDTFDLEKLTTVKPISSSRGRQHRLTLGTSSRKCQFAFSSASELYHWYGDIYAQSPLASRNPLAQSRSTPDLNAFIESYTSTARGPDSPWQSSTRTASTSVGTPRIGLNVSLDDISKTRAWQTPHSSYLAPLPPSNDARLISLDGQSEKNSDARDDQLNPEQQNLIREAVTVLCNSMEPRLLRKSEPGGEKPFDLVEIRLRSLARLQRKWNASSSSALPSSEETLRVFSDSLRDGYVLCQLMNTLQSNPVLRPDAGARDLDDNSNITKFLKACIGMPSDDLFFPNDISDATATSLTRVARTIISLAKFVEDSTPKRRIATTNALINFARETDIVEPPFGTTDDVDLERWIDNLIVTRRRKSMSSRGSHTTSDDGERLAIEVFSAYGDLLSPVIEQPTPKVYQSTLSFLLDVASLKSERLYGSLERLHHFITTLDPISSLIDSRQFRLKLLHISAELEVSDDPRIRVALEKDDVEISKVLNKVISNASSKQAVLRLKGEDAQTCVDLIQDVLDKGSIRSKEDEEFTLKARRLLVKLSQARDVLPQRLFITGVQGTETEPTFGGAFGDIFRASYKGQDVALKRIRVFQRDATRHKIRQRFCREALLWQRLKHPYVLPFSGIDAETFPSFLCMVSPWMRHGTILKHLAENGNSNVERRLFEIAQGLEYLHSQNIVHGDLRGSNILVDDEWHACLADFGLAVFADATAATHTSHQAGSVRWMAPELHDPQSFGIFSFKRTFASDVYSFACVALELYTGKPPFADLPHCPAAMLRALEGKRPSRPVSSTGDQIIPDYIWNIIGRCWTHHYADRPSISEVVRAMSGANPELAHTIIPAPLVNISNLNLPEYYNLRRKPASRRSKNARPLRHQESRSF